MLMCVMMLVTFLFDDFVVVVVGVCMVADVGVVCVIVGVVVGVDD